jgi:hypothetical protein
LDMTTNAYRAQAAKSWDAMTKDAQLKHSAKVADIRKNGPKVPAHDGQYYETRAFAGKPGRERVCLDYTGNHNSCGSRGHDVPQCTLNNKRSASVSSITSRSSELDDIKSMLAAITRPICQSAIANASTPVAATVTNNNAPAADFQKDIMNLLGRVMQGDEEAMSIAAKYSAAPIISINTNKSTSLRVHLDDGLGYMPDTGSGITICSYNFWLETFKSGLCSDLLDKTSGLELKSCSDEDDASTTASDLGSLQGLQELRPIA